MTAPFDLAPLLVPNNPAPAVRWNGFPKYNFIGGHNDAAHVPVDALIEAATTVLKREGATLATYGLNSGPQGYRPLREFLAKKLKGHAGVECTADEILMISGSTQALDLVNGLLVIKGDTVLIEQETYGSAINRLVRLGVNVVGIPLDEEGMRLDVMAEKLAELKKQGITPKYIYTIPTVQNPTGGILGQQRPAELIAPARQSGVLLFADDGYSDLISSATPP
ncbi:MAG: PLP-dependent aminotransferase family protein, partial [Reyranella sp.]|nr:PLP-dependent aminotransferase family protein [Reyranella sp.]